MQRLLTLDRLKTEACTGKWLPGMTHNNNNNNKEGTYETDLYGAFRYDLRGNPGVFAPERIGGTAPAGDAKLLIEYVGVNGGKSTGSGVLYRRVGGIFYHGVGYAGVDYPRVEDYREPEERGVVDIPAIPRGGNGGVCQPNCVPPPHCVNGHGNDPNTPACEEKPGDTGVPEPAAWMLMGAGLGAVWGWRRGGGGRVHPVKCASADFLNFEN